MSSIFTAGRSPCNRQVLWKVKHAEILSKPLFTPCIHLDVCKHTLRAHLKITTFFIYKVISYFRSCR